MNSNVGVSDCMHYGCVSLYCAVGVSDCMYTGCGIVRLYWMWDCQTVLDVGLSDCTGCGIVRQYWMWDCQTVLDVVGLSRIVAVSDCTGWWACQTVIIAVHDSDQNSVVRTGGIWNQLHDLQLLYSTSHVRCPACQVSCTSGVLHVRCPARQVSCMSGVLQARCICESRFN